MSLLLVRVVLPAAIALAGSVLVVAGGETAQGAANVFMRLALQSERDRLREQARRR
jgi:hypothetical protein